MEDEALKLQVNDALDRLKLLEERYDLSVTAQGQPAQEEVFEALTDRVELLEAELVKERNAVLRKLAAYGGLAAVLISIGVGAVTLIDRFHFDRLRTIEAQKGELNTIVSRLTEINWSLLELRNGPNADFATDFTQLANGEKAALLQRASEVVGDLGEQISFPVATALAYESLSFSDVVEANRYSQIALTTAPTDGFRVNAMTHLARTYTMQGPLFDLSKARDLFDDALGVADTMPSGTGERFALPVLTDWTVGEAYFGDCARAQDLVTQAQALIVELPDGQSVHDQYFRALKSRLDQQNRCVIATP